MAETTLDGSLFFISPSCFFDASSDCQFGKFAGWKGCMNLRFVRICWHLNNNNNNNLFALP